MTDNSKIYAWLAKSMEKGPAVDYVINHLPEIQEKLAQKDCSIDDLGLSKDPEKFKAQLNEAMAKELLLKAEIEI